MTFAAGERPTVQQLNAILNQVNINNPLAGTTTSTSTSYANVGAPASVSITKAFDASLLRVDLHISCFSAVAGTTVPRFAVQISGTDYDMCGFLINTVSEHLQFSGSRLVSGILAGARTVQVRVRRVSGAGTITIDSSDWVSLTVVEV